MPDVGADATSVAAWLVARGAPPDAVAWAQDFGADFGEAWRACRRGDWLLVIAAGARAPAPALVAAAAGCARSCLYVVPDDAGASDVLDVVEAWASGGRAPIDPVELNARLDRAPTADPAVATAIEALRAVVETAADPRRAADAAANAVECAALAVGECAMAAAVGEAHESCARAVRTAIRFETLRFE